MFKVFGDARNAWITELNSFIHLRPVLMLRNGLLDMEDSEIASSSLEGSPIVINGESGMLLQRNVFHGIGSSEEAWFDDDCDNDLELNKEWKLRRDKFYSDGYREGIIEGQKDAAQHGFNQGFKDSVMFGFKWGVVRGVTSSLAHIPDEVKEKLVVNEEVRREFTNLHRHVDPITTENALKLYYDHIRRDKYAEQNSDINSALSLTQQTEYDGLETYVKKLEFILTESRVISVPLEANKSAGS